MKINKTLKIALTLILTTVALIAPSTHGQTNLQTSLQTKVFDQSILDLNGDGLLEKIIVANTGDDLAGELFLQVNNQRIVLEKAFYPPNHQMYKVYPYYIKRDNNIDIIIDLSQFSNGVGSNSFLRIYRYENQKITPYWDYNSISTPKLSSKLIEGDLLISSNDNTLNKRITLTTIPEDIRLFESYGDIPREVNDYYVSLPSSTEIVFSKGEYFIDTYRVMRYPIMMSLIKTRYKISKEGVVLQSRKLIY